MAKFLVTSPGRGKFIGISVTPNLTELVVKYRQAPGLIREQIRAIFSELGIRSRETLRAHAPADTGALKKSINSQLQPLGNHFKLTVSMAEYGFFLNTGTRPVNLPYSNIAAWARRRGLPPDSGFAKGREGGYYYLWKHIKETGVDPNPWLDRAAPEIKGDIENTLRFLGSMVSGILSGVTKAGFRPDITGFQGTVQPLGRGFVRTKVMR